MSHMFVPGPVDVADEVLQAQTRPMIPHRSAEFEAIFRRASEKAAKIFFTEARVFITASSGTGLQEASVRNLAKSRVLSCVNGAFGARWYDVARLNGKDAVKLEFEWDEPLSPEKIAEAVKTHHPEVVTMVHNETSTGMMNPVREVAAAVHAADPEVLVLVDAVSSFSGAKIEVDAWGLDLVLTSSQKCLALPPGLALAAVSDRAMEKAESVPNRGWYFDFLRMEKHRLKDSTPATPAVSLIYALDFQLDRILDEGIEARFARHAEMAQRVQSWAEGRGMSIFAPAPYRSHTVTTIRNTLGWEIGKVNEYLLARGMRIANGYGPLKNKTFRIAHMGETTMSDIDALLAALDEM